jgi:hypothetical protein
MRYIKILCFLLLLVSPLAAARGQEKDIPARPRLRHEWDGFAAGSSAQVQRKRIVYDDNGAVESSSTIKTTSTLVSRENGFNEIRSKLVIDIAGKVFNPDPTSSHSGGVSEKPGQKVKYEFLLKEKLNIDDQEFECKKFQVTIESSVGRRISRVWMCNQYPFVLKSESVVTLKNSNTAVRTAANIVALNMPMEVLTDIKSGVVIRIVTETEGSRAVTLQGSCPDVPGGVVWHSKKVVVDGKLQEESYLRLIAYRSEREVEVSKPDRPRRSGVISRIKQNRNKPPKDEGGRKDDERKRACHGVSSGDLFVRNSYRNDPFSSQTD